MHYQTLKPPITCSSTSLHSAFHYNTLRYSLFSRRKTDVNSISSLFVSWENRKEVRIAATKAIPVLNNCIIEENERAKNVIKHVDVATLGNLCVDIVLNVPVLPPSSANERFSYMKNLSASQPDKKYWEAGGNCNLTIAAARLGLHCVTLGHVGDEIYGHFLLDVLNDEGIHVVGMSENTDDSSSYKTYETLLCWVLVDPLQRHGFCSRADFSKEPAFNWIVQLSENTKKAIKQSKILFCNGYAFDEMSPELIISAVEYAMKVGAALFFDPGPRGKSLANGTPEQQSALQLCLRMSDVLLLTSEEAESLTGISNPAMAAQELIKKGLRIKWIIIKMGRKGSILVTNSTISFVPAFKVDVVDTVGCGDSFTAAVVFGFLHKLPTISTLTLANAVGAATAMGCGAGRNVARLKNVLNLLKGYNLSDYNVNDLNMENLDTSEILILSKTATEGNQDGLVHVSLQKVVSELVLKLENIGETRTLTFDREKKIK